MKLAWSMSAITHLLGAVLAAACVARGEARDGVVEINQVRARAGGVTAGDAPGFPVTLDAPGSYRLTSSLDVRNEPNAIALQAVVIRADAVHLDLNGFRIVGPVRCSGDPPATPVACTPTGNSGAAVYVEPVAGVDPAGVEIRNGTVEGFAYAGINCGSSCTVDRVQSRHNEGFGIRIGSDSIARDAVVELNADHGIAGGARTVVDGVRSTRNGGAGVRLGPGALLSRCLVARNVLAGIVGFALVGDDSAAPAYRDCVFVLNAGGNANSQTNAIALGPNVCGTDTVCP
jgi:hypothetical protein